jgi:hypothetical protein
MNSFLQEHIEKYKTELDGFTFIHHSEDNLDLLEHKGGTIKFINGYGELKGGGIFLKLLGTEKNKLTELKLLMKIPNKLYQLSYSKNYIFYSKGMVNGKLVDVNNSNDKKRKIMQELLAGLFS